MEFTADFPFQILAVNPRFNRNGEWILNKQDSVVAELSPPRVILPLFTDDDLADRYSDARSIESHTILISDAEAASEVVTKLSNLHGLTHVVFDPTWGRRVRNLIPVSEFLKSMRNCTGESGHSQGSQE